MFEKWLKIIVFWSFPLSFFLIIPQSSHCSVFLPFLSSSMGSGFHVLTVFFCFWCYNCVLKWSHWDHLLLKIWGNFDVLSQKSLSFLDHFWFPLLSGLQPNQPIARDWHLKLQSCFLWLLAWCHIAQLFLISFEIWRVITVGSTWAFVQCWVHDHQQRYEQHSFQHNKVRINDISSHYKVWLVSIARVWLITHVHGVECEKYRGHNPHNDEVLTYLPFYVGSTSSILLPYVNGFLCDFQGSSHRSKPHINKELLSQALVLKTFFQKGYVQIIENV